MKIMLYAYVDENIGDDLFIDLICRRYKNVEFYLYVPEKYINNYRYIKNLKCIPYKEINKNLDRINRWFFKGKLTSKLYFNKMYKLDKKWVKNMDAQLWLGGSQFVETEDWKNVIDYKLKQQKLKDIPFFSISATIGPYSSREYENAIQKVVAGYDHIVLRDKISYELLQERNNASYTYDMVFNIESKCREKKKEVCISVIDMYGRTSEKLAQIYEEFIGKITKRYIALGYKINFLSLCENQKDKYAIERIVRDNNLENVRIFSYTNNLEEIINVIDNASIMIGTRYHSIVVALKFGLKVLPISYESKTDNLMIMMEKNTIKIENITNIEVDNLDKYMVILDEKEKEHISKSAELQYKDIDIWMETEE